MTSFEAWIRVCLKPAAPLDISVTRTNTILFLFFSFFKKLKHNLSQVSLSHHPKTPGSPWVQSPPLTSTPSWVWRMSSCDGQQEWKGKPFNLLPLYFIRGWFASLGSSTSSSFHTGGGKYTVLRSMGIFRIRLPLEGQFQTLLEFLGIISGEKVSCHSTVPAFHHPYSLPHTHTQTCSELDKSLWGNRA